MYAKHRPLLSGTGVQCATRSVQRDESQYSAEVSAASGDGDDDGEVVRIKYHLRLCLQLRLWPFVH